jgi:putative hydrolase of the HAD superfamily
VAAFEATAEVAEVDTPALVTAVRARARALWNATPAHPYCKRIGISSSEAMWCRFEGDGPEVTWLRAWAPEYRREAWRLALAEQGVDDAGLAEALGERFGVERRARHEVFPDAVPALIELGERHALALVTNGAACLQREKLAASGLADHFAAVVVSADVGAGKPIPHRSPPRSPRSESNPPAP